jgi:Kdo2-lipid IVA lauroyltransferase/acyltransferase
MKVIKYFIQFLIIVIFFLLFSILGRKISSSISNFLFSIIGPFFRSKDLIKSNLNNAMPNLLEEELQNIITKMWGNYGRILSEYIFLKNFRNSRSNYVLNVEGQDILDEIKKKDEPVIFVSGHFNNFELMAMHIDKSNINLAAIYRPLNNKFLNLIMERLRKKYICKNQIKKGISGTKKLLSLFKNGTSIALMIDQRVSEGIESTFFQKGAYTTTLPAQFVKKFNCKIVPIYIERQQNINFKLTIHSPIEYSLNDTIQTITLDLNKRLEEMILKNPDQWIWSHNRWKK